jgi:hypothetical protein
MFVSKRVGLFEIKCFMQFVPCMIVGPVGAEHSACRACEFHLIYLQWKEPEREIHTPSK